jgi:D-glycerate 3-kinase
VSSLISNPSILEAIEAMVVDGLASCARRPFLLGICGAQGSGKSTVAAQVVRDLDKAGIRAAVVSIDDLYKTKVERAAMARELHPLFATRGVPGTHDLALFDEVLAALACGRAAWLPRFDKAADDRAPKSAWDSASGATEVLILEGWCVGARPARGPQAAGPTNRLEAEEDIDGKWRDRVEAFLREDYQALFARIDRLVFLSAPSFEIVHSWRAQQEEMLHASRGGGMRRDEISRFIQHYERLTRRMLREMPDYADLTVLLDPQRRPIAIKRKISHPEGNP